jgi:hypothetical protein
MKAPNPHCPICLERIESIHRDFEHIVCSHCQISFAGFELFDALPDFASNDAERILPFGFATSRTPSLDPLRKILASMHRVFELLVTGEAPGVLCPEGYLMAYLTSLVEGQRGELKGIPADSWSLIKDGETEAGGRGEFVYLPSYLAVGTLAYTVRRTPSLAQEIPSLQRSLERGLDFTTGQGVAGAGHEWLEWRQRILGIFERGQVLALLLDRPETSPRMCYVLGYVHQRTAEILAKIQGDIEYGTRGPVSREVYEKIAEQTAAFKNFSGEEELSHP